MLDPHPAGVEPREVEQVGGELRQPRHLLAHRLEELLARLLVQVLVGHQLQEPAQREQRRAQLVRRVGDELASGALEVLEPAGACGRTRAASSPSSSRPRSTTGSSNARRRCARRRARAAGSGARAARRRRSRRRARTRARSGPRPAAAAATRCTLDERVDERVAEQDDDVDQRGAGTATSANRVPCRSTVALCVTPLAAARRATRSRSTSREERRVRVPGDRQQLRRRDRSR